MSDLAGPLFHHRHNRDGSFDSICAGCLLTVGCVAVESELTDHENAHTCSAARRFGVAMGASQSSD